MKYILLMLSIFMANVSHGEDIKVSALANQYEISADVLEDFVNSYNFKCPKEITSWQLEVLLDALDEDTELSVMVESDKMDWRDMYVEARSGIACMTDGAVSKGY